MLTDTQFDSLKTDILANAVVGGALETAVAIGSDIAVATYYNALASPSVKIWLPRVTLDNLNSAIVWSDFVALTALKQNTYIAMTQAGFVDASDAQVRAGFVAVFGGASASITAITAMAQRDATRLEALFSSGSGPKTSAVFGYVLQHLEVARALRA